LIGSSFCYDNEGYGNTGQQSSGATPHGARTADSRAYPGFKKDLFAIWAAHRPAYAASVIAAEPLDLAKKIERAKAIKGPRLALRDIGIGGWGIMRVTALGR
jgi:pyruvate ferredoxin oxidoreductase beta subunit